MTIAGAGRTGRAATAKRWTVRPLATLLVVLAVAACAPALEAPAVTTGISKISTTTTGGWRYDYYRNTTYPCSISGHQTFTIATKVGAPASATAPLWVWMHGGGVGFFDSTGTPQPDASNMVEESPDEQRQDLAGGGLFSRVRGDAAGFRMLAVSYCDRDLYSGALQTDPNNPNKLADGSSRKTNGLLATKSAVQYMRDRYPTAETFLHGGSAGSAGSYYVAWALQRQGIPLAGVVADASVVNREAIDAAREQEICGPTGSDSGDAIAARVHSELADMDNEPDRLVSRGELTVPLMHIWNPGDGPCGTQQLACPLRNGSTASLSVPDCTHQPLQAAIGAGAPANRSMNLRLCVDDVRVEGACDKHVVTTADNLVNTDPSLHRNQSSGLRRPRGAGCNVQGQGLLSADVPPSDRSPGTAAGAAGSFPAVQSTSGRLESTSSKKRGWTMPCRGHHWVTSQREVPPTLAEEIT